MSEARPVYLLTLTRPDRPVQRIVLPSLPEALEAAREDARWLRGLGSVLVSLLIDVRANV